MPTRPENIGLPGAGAHSEAVEWSRIADAATSLVGIHPSPTEAEVVRFFNPHEDLQRRAGRWQHELPDHELGSIALFAGGLALAEAAAWDGDQPDVAARAFTDRRHLVADRLIHWAVPWLVAVGQARPDLAIDSSFACRSLLDIGDKLRVAPGLGGHEGLVPPGEDLYGPIDSGRPLADLVRSVWSGAVLIDPGSLHDGSSRRPRDVAAEHYREAARTWSGLAETHVGSAGLWRDLASRATRTARAVEADRNA